MPMTPIRIRQVARIVARNVAERPGFSTMSLPDRIRAMITELDAFHDYTTERPTPSDREALSGASHQAIQALFYFRRNVEAARYHQEHALRYDLAGVPQLAKSQRRLRDKAIADARFCFNLISPKGEQQ